MKKNLTHKLLSGFLAVIMAASSVTTPVFASDEQLAESTSLIAESTVDPADSVVVVVDEDGMIHLSDAEEVEAAASITSQAEEPESVPEQSEESTGILHQEEQGEPESEQEEPESEQEEPESEQEEEKLFASIDPDSVLSDAELSKIDFSSKRLLVAADADVILDPEHVLSEYNGVFLLQYESAETARNAFSYYYGLAEFVEVDATVSIADEPYAESAVAEKEMTEAENPLAALAESAEYAQKEARQEAKEKLPLIAVIDTGASTSENIVEAISMIDADPMDQNGHGTNMIAVITAQNPDARILSIKALGADGTGDVSAVYAAIQYAIERGASYINLSISALASADNELIGQIITDAVSSGITVVGAAGNNHRNAKYYIPGSIDAAVVVGACDEDGNRLAASNYGDSVDYYAKAASTSEAAAIVTGLMSAGTFEADGKIVKSTIVPSPDNTDQGDAPESHSNVKDDVKRDLEALQIPDDVASLSDEEIADYGYRILRICRLYDADPKNFAEKEQTVLKRYFDLVNSGYEIKVIEPANVFTTAASHTSGSYRDGRFMPVCTKISQDNDRIGWTYHYWTGTNKVEYCYEIDKDSPYGRTVTDGSRITGKIGVALCYLLANGVATTGGRMQNSAYYLEANSDVLRNNLEYHATQIAVWLTLYKCGLTSNGISESNLGISSQSTDSTYTQAQKTACRAMAIRMANDAIAYAKANNANGNGTTGIRIAQGQNLEMTLEGNYYVSPQYDVQYTGWPTSRTVTLSGAPAGAEIVYDDSSDTHSSFRIRVPKANVTESTTFSFTISANFLTNMIASPANTNYQTVLFRGDNASDTATRTVKLNYVVENGKVNMKKTSSRTADTNGNTAYNMNGAVYTIYRDSACTDSTGETLTLGSYDAATSSATSNTVELPLGTYYLKETTAPTNGSYKLSTTVTPFEITADYVTNALTVSVTDEPSIPRITLNKTSAKPTITNGNSSYNMVGIKYTVYKNAACTQSTGKTFTIASYDKATSTGTSSGIDLPAGTYYLKETTVPAGSNYVKSDAVTTLKITANESTKSVNVTDAGQVGYIRLVKTSSDTTKTNGSADYDMTGATYSVTNTETKAVVGNLVVGTYDKTTSTGTTNTLEVPLGSYELVETAGPTSGTYAVNTAKITATVTANNVTTATAVVAAQTETPGQGKASLKKVSASTSVTNNNSTYTMVGAEYTIYKDSACTQSTGQKFTIGTYTASNSTGTSNTVTLPYGTYYAKETKAPTSGTYKLDTTVRSFTLTKDHASATLVVAATDPPEQGKLTLAKKSSNTAVTNNNNQYSMVGAEYTIYKDQACTTKATNTVLKVSSYNAATSTATTNTVTLPFGTYYVKETKAPTATPSNYTLSTVVTKVVVGTANKTTAVSANVTETPVQGYLKLVKTSSDTAKTNGSSEYDMTGAEYSIHSETQNKDMTEKLTVTSYDRATSTGTTNTVQLPIGTYTLTETKGPDNGSYSINTTPITVTVTADHTTVATAVVANDLETPGEGGAVLKKVSSDTTITNGNSNYSMAGAEYTIYTDSACTQSTGKKFTISAYSATNSTGTSNTVSLPLGTYYAKETKAPTNGSYELDTTVRSFTLSPDNATATVTVNATDPPVIGKFNIRKESTNHDATDNNDAYSMMGAQYTVYTDSAATASTGKVLTIGSYNKTTSTGTSNTVELPIGTYYIKETKAPTATNANYKMSTTITKIVVTKDHKTTALTTTEKEEPELGYITLVKVSSDTSKTNGKSSYSMLGAEYTIKSVRTNADLTDKLVVTSYDAATSTARTNVVAVPLGDYTVRETKAPTNGSYELNTAVINVSVTKANKTETAAAVVNAQEAPASGGVSIKKVSSKTNVSNGNTAYSMAGAEYTIFTDSACTQAIGEKLIISSYTSATSTGTSNTVSLPLGTYYVKETKAPTNGTYKLNTTVYTFEITEDNLTENLVVNVTDEPVTTFFQIKKTSTDTNATNNNDSYDMTGAEYTVYKNAAATTSTGKKATITSYDKTTSTGTSTKVELPIGTYYVKETKAPTGANGNYKLSTAITKVVVTKDHTTSTPLSVSVTDEPKLGYLKLVKTSSNTSKTNGKTDYDMTGAKYSVTSVRTGEVVGTLTVTSYDAATSTGTTGTLTLPLGEYTLKETKAPTNGSFALSTETVSVTVTKSNLTTATAAVASALETPVDGKAVLKKVSSDTSITNGNSTYTMAGAEYTIYKDADCTQSTGKKFTIGTYTAANSTGTSNTVTLPLGTYYAKETKAPTSGTYKLDTTVRSFTLTKDNVSAALTVNATDPPEQGQITLVKKSSDTASTNGNSNYSMMGAEYTIYKNQACTKSTGKVLTVTSYNAATSTGTTGTATLPFGTYYVKETKAPTATQANYEMSTAVTEVVVGVAAKTTPVTTNVTETPLYGYLTLEKVSATPDTTNGNSDYDMTGAEYSITEQGKTTARPEKLTVTSYDTATSTARTNTVKLPIGTYILKETKAPTNGSYTLSTATITAVVTAGHTTTAPLVAHATESPKSGKLKIEKVSSDHTTTDGRTEYSAIGAVYTIYTDDACKNPVGQTLTIGEYDAATSTGTSGEVTLPLGTYYLKETTAPTNKSYKLNTTVYTAEVTTDHVTNALTVSATDAPEVGRARLRKDSAHTANTNNNPAYSSVGAVYRIYSDSACKNATGKEFKVNSYTTSNSRGWSNVVTLPFGTYWAKEVTLPTNGSFKLNATAIKFTVTPDNISSNSTVAAKDEEVMGYLSIEKESANHALTDGNDGYDMTGATFSVVNKDSGKEEGTLTISSYNTATSKGTSNTLQVPLGTYTLTETSAPANGSYEINTTPIEVTVTTSNVTTATAVMAHQTETPGMNPFLMALQKIDSVTGESKPEGNATLAGAEFTLRFYAVDPATHTTAASVSSLAPAKTWVIETKKVGNAYRAMLSAAYLKSGDTFYGTNAAGNATLPYGVLTITETKAPTGYQAAHSYKTGGSTISDTTIAVQIAPGGNKLVVADSTIAEPDVLDANEKPYLGGIKIVKYDSSTSDGTAEGDADLSGIRFELKNASDNAVTVSGTSYAPGAVIMTLTTNASGKAQTNNKVLPYGRYTVQEVASNGKYRLTDGEAHTVTVNSTTSVTENFYNEVTRGGGAVVKLDAETANGAAQGDGDFSGITFRIVNRSAKPVVLKNGTVVPVGGEVMTITTDASGHAATEADALPYGTYEITEISANNAYLLTDTTPQTITIREDGQIESVTFRNLIKRGGVEVVKHDAETGTNVPLGTATLEGITFTITNASTKAVMIGGTSYAPNAVVATITTSADGIARTSVDALPYGTYKIRETATNDTYLLTDGSEKTFEIRNSGELVSTDTAGGPLVFTNQVKRGDFRIVKTDKDTNAPMPNVRFLITSNTTGEAHEVMTGADGTYDSSQIRHSLNTNRGQAGDGVWFGLGAASGRTDDGDTPVQLPVRDDVGALPLGTYTITELDSGEANRGSLLITQEFEITAEGVATVLLLEIKDNVPKISTEAKAENGTNYLDAKSPVTITDTVTYSGLIPGRTYQLTGTLYERLADGSAQNLNITSQPVDFTPAEEAGSQPVVFTFDSTALAGKTLVVYEKLFEGGVQVAEHEDINDEAQTLHVVSIDTTATANETGTHSVMNRASVTITDRVEYKGLDPTKTYTMRGVLMSKETGAPILVNGAQVTATQTFKPAQPNGTIDMTYTFNAHALAGNHIVVFEELLLDNTVIADHKDIDDDDQTVYIAPKPPTLHTGGEGTGMFHLSGIFMSLILMIAEAFRRRRRKIA